MKTIKDIAQAANCSVSTVSKALNNRSDVSQTTKKRILKIAKENNFYPNAFGKALKSKSTENIGVIFCRESQPLSSNPFYSRVLEGIEAELAIHNYNLVLQLISDENKSEIPKMIRERQIDGLILVGVINQTFVDQLKQIDLPLILIDPKIEQESKWCQILIDNEDGAMQAVQYLIQSGHQRIGFISGDLERQSFSQRFRGYKRALKFNNIPFSEELVQTGGLEKGYEHTARLLDLDNPPTALFSANDINAIYAYKAITERGLAIAGDISVVGFDDIELSRMASPPLTTVRVYKEEMGSIAVRRMISVIQDSDIEPNTTLVPTRLVVRESVRHI
ncbi:MAG: LacI family DNA-binding transcriptional regulator [candidate division KSB1 bacterium]|nr:LacI family DNA-binding transcriptional regulator [candidate division KSB1 bacterium]